VHRQLASAITTSEGAPAVVISGSKEIEPGARAALLHAEGLFRLDVVVEGDTLRTVVRNLSDGPLAIDGRPDEDQGAHLVIGDVTGYEPARADLKFALGTGLDRVEANVLMGILHFADRGTVRVTAQAVLRQSPAS
jgi:hypothetical protein